MDGLTGSKDKGSPLPLQRKHIFQVVVVHHMTAINGIHNVGVAAAGPPIQPAHTLRLSYIGPVLGENDHQLITTLLQGTTNWDGIGKASIKVGHSVEFHRTAGNRDGTGGHDQAVIVLRHHFPPIVLRQACQRVCDHNLILRRIFHQSGKIQRIFPFPAGQFTIDVLQSKQISGFQQTSQPKVIRRMNMLRKKAKIPASLPRQIGSQIA